MTYEWDNTLEEWYVNDTRGLEHGFTVKARPVEASAPNSQSSTLDILLAVRGDLRPEVQTDGVGVYFRDAQGNVLMTYDGLTVLDADGRKVPARFTASDAKSLRIAIDERGARYPLTVDPFARQAYLKASNTGAGDNFGRSVAISGDTVVVGAIFEDSNATGVNGDQANNASPNSGAAYVFVRFGHAWIQQAYLKPSNTGSDDWFGISVAISGDTIVVGAQYEASSATGVNGNQADNSAGSAGAAYVFVRNGTTWSQQAYLKASNTGGNDRFGESVAISGDTIVVGAYLEDSNATGINGDGSDNSAVDSGAAYVFVRSGTTWTQQAYLKASNTEAGDFFGESVSVSGDTIVVGAETEDSNATGVNGDQSDNSASIAGAAYVFVRDGATWSQQAYLKASNAESGDRFGYSVAVSGDTVLVGATGEDSSAQEVNGDQSNNSIGESGAAYVFVREGTNWSQQAYIKATYPDISANFGWAVAVDGDTAVIGAPRYWTLRGWAQIYTRSGTAWTFQNAFYDSNIDDPNTTDLFGQSVAVSSNTIVVGQPLEDSNATGVNGSQYNSSVLDSGAAFVFTVPSTQLLALVDIDATGLPPGLLTAITNRGAMGGFFEARGGGATVPSIAPVDGGGTLGIIFDGNDYLQHVSAVGGPVVSSPLVGVNTPCTIEAWVLNGAIDREETIVSWGRRGGSPDGSNLAFNYGWDAAWGAVGHWGSTDIGWTSGTDGGGVYGAGVPSAGAWHHLVFTWDGSSTQRVYADGVQKNSETVSLQIASGPAFILAAQTDSNGSTVATGNRGSLTIGRLRILDGAMTAAQVATNYLTEVGLFTNGPGSPLVTGPTHRYQFNNTSGAATAGSVIQDSVGTANGTVLGSGATFTGSRLSLPGGTSGTAAYVDLPDGLLSANSTNKGGSGEVTIEGWAKATGSRTWARLFDFGSSSGGSGLDYLTYIAQVNAEVHAHRLTVQNTDTVGGTGGGGFLEHGTTTYGQDFHFAITWNDATGEMKVFENGAFVGRRTEAARMTQINDVNNWLGRSQWSGDQNLQGELEEFRIYNRALSDAEIRGNFLRGPDTISANNNNRPVLVNFIADQSGSYGTPFNFTFAANTFNDVDAGQALSYSAAGMPAGIIFTPATRTFSGTPTNAGTISVTVTATDNGSPALSTNDLFDIVITKAPLTATADNQSRGYGQPNPPFTIGYSGFMLGESDSVLDTPPVPGTSATSSSPVGPYPITLAGGVDDHYDFSYGAGTLSITPAPLTVTANDTNRVYGTANPDFAGSLVGLLNGDNITATFTTAATIASPPGTYLITPVLSDPDGRLSNYAVTTNTGTLTITPPPTLSFTMGGGGGGLFTLSWPAIPTGFLLEYTESLTPPVDWHEVTSGITENGGIKSYTVMNDPGVPGRLYRLRLP